MKKLFILTLLTLLVSISISAQNNSVSKKHEFKGTIQTQNSEVIAGANLYFKSDKQNFTVVTDINGEFKTELEAENYQITVNDVLSKSFKAFIRIQDEGANPNDVNFIVKTNKNPCGLSENEICPKPISFPKPPFPVQAIIKKLTGEVIVKIKVDKNGQVVDAVAQSGHSLFRQAAVLAAKKSKFETSDISEFRELELIYVFLDPRDTKDNNYSKRYKNTYRITMERNIIVDCFNNC